MVYNIINVRILSENRKLPHINILYTKTMQKYKTTIEYDGTNMFGFQKQGNLPTVQFCIENAIYKMTGENVKIVVAAGRTDAGVHATCQVIDFDIKKTEKQGVCC